MFSPSRFALRLTKRMKVLPVISETERQALVSGQPWVDGYLFGGGPDFAKILDLPYSDLSDEEIAFINGPVRQLCTMFDRYELEHTHVIPAEVLDFIKKNGFMGLFLPKEHGGKGFSRQAISTILHTLTPYSFTVTIMVMIPNSLGAAELIEHYGTDEQKRDYLAKLASGQYVPCFGLTEETAGSDAASMKSEAVVFTDSDSKVKLRLNFKKRYISLAPVANLATIACILKDPGNLLGQGTQPGITCVLVHEDTPGFTHGLHHLPIGEAFENGPLDGVDVVVPVDNIIGGVDGAGQGWRMLMEQLAGGRAISLPGASVGNMKLAAMTTGAYSMVREQFNRQIGTMEGVADKVGFIAGMTYMCDAARRFVCSAVDDGVQPPVTSAILKAYTTELGRQVVVAGMDVFAGSGVMQGPRNILGKAYMSTPVGITVEGANILTRNLIIFGQGAVRCHPYALKVVNAVDADNATGFRNGMLGWVGHAVFGGLRYALRSATRGFLTVGVPRVGRGTATYYRRLGWAASQYGMLTDLSMFTMGGKLKGAQMYTGRLADAAAWMLLGISALRRYEAEGCRKEDKPLVDYALEYALKQVQIAYEGICDNFSVPVLGFCMRLAGGLWQRLNPLGHGPTDSQTRKAARCIQTCNEQFMRLTDGVIVDGPDRPGLGQLIHAFRLTTETQDITAKVIEGVKAKLLPRGSVVGEIALLAAEKGVITQEEATRLQEAHAARLLVIKVDTFTHAQYYAAAPATE